ncbi:hypothetical protein ABR28_15580 [Enterobacter hormaechei subsp. hoffmannii]|nr:hypothetical protein ABR28_15580 [Enterobacter hormaechei subsp. hoffmannii]
MPFAHLRILSVIAFTCLYPASPAMSATTITLVRPVRHHVLYDMPVSLPVKQGNQLRIEVRAMESGTWTAAQCKGTGNYSIRYAGSKGYSQAMPFTFDTSGEAETNTPSSDTPPEALHVRIDVDCRPERATSAVATIRASVLTAGSGDVGAVGTQPYTLPSGFHSAVTVADRIDFGNVPTNTETEWVPVFENYTGEHFPYITVNGVPVMSGGTSTRARIQGKHGVVSVNGYNAQYAASGHAGQERLVLDVNLSVP